MSIATFDKLLGLINSRIEKRSIRKPIPADIRLYITLRYLATGDSYHSLHLLFRVGASTIREIVLETCEVLWHVLSPIVLSEPTEEEWGKISHEYETEWNLPLCCGALDGKHIRIQAPPKSGSTFHNYKHFYSEVLLALCDANYNITYVDIGSVGSQSDGGVLENSTLGQMLENNQLKFPSGKWLPGTRIPFNHYVIADTAFPLTHNIVTPYRPPKKRKTMSTQGRNSSIRESQTVETQSDTRRCALPNHILYFNYRLRRARMAIENAFGILVSRWRIFHRTIVAFPENVDKIVMATIVLHNFIKSKKGDNIRYCPFGYADYEVDGEMIPGRWRKETLKEHLNLVNNKIQSRHGSITTDIITAKRNRDILLNYISPPPIKN